LPGVEVLQGNEVNFPIKSTVVFEGDPMHVADPIAQARVQVEIVFTEVRPQTNEPSTEHEREIVGKKNFGSPQKTPSKPVVSECNAQIIPQIAHPQPCVGSKHAILKNVFVVMINVIQTEIEGSAVGHSRSAVCIGHCSVGPPITEIQNKIGGVTGQAVGGNLERITFDIHGIPAIDDRVSKTKIILTQSRFCAQRKRGEEEKSECG